MKFWLWAFCITICALWAAPTTVAAYGGGTQAEAYPQVVPAAQFCELAETKFAEYWVEIGETRRYELKLMREPPAIRCPAGEITSEVSISRKFRYGATLPIMINTYLDGKFYRRITCYYRVNVYENVLVATHDLALEQPITAADVRREERAIDDRGAKYLTDPAEAVGRVPARAIRAGTCLTERMIQNPVVMEVGAPITLVANYNGVQVKTEGVAMQRGRIGKIIKVRNARSAKVLRGKIIDESTVEIL